MIKKNIIVANLNITYYQSSTFEPKGALVFLHGWQSQALHLKSIFENLDNYIAIDLPGFGLSDRPANPWSLNDYANLLASLLDKLGLTNPVLIGHSVGGAIIIKFLAQGGTAEKIILIDPSGIRNYDNLKKLLLRLSAKIIKLILSPLPAKFYNSLRHKAYRAIGSEDYVEAGLLVETYKKIIAEDLQGDLAAITVPTTLIWGKNDTAAPIEHGWIMNELIKNSTLHIIDNAGHFPFIDQPEKFKEVFSKKLYAN
jgi:pimeloyl-ACP methyl ester carboxylesterase